MTREAWLDFLRVTACFLVMTVHATEPFYLGGDGTLVLSGADAFWVSVFEGLARCCVPLFVIASGYLQLPLKYPAGEFFRRRFVRVVVPMVIWTLVYAFAYGSPASSLKGLLLNFNYAGFPKGAEPLSGSLGADALHSLRERSRRRNGSHDLCGRRPSRPGPVPALG